MIFVLFSPQAQFLAKFFSTQKRVNRDKTDFATKQRKSQNEQILQQNSIICIKTLLIVHIIFLLNEEMVKFLYIHHVEITPILYICHVAKSELMDVEQFQISPHSRCGQI